MKTLITALGLCLLIVGGAGEASAQGLPIALSSNPKPANLSKSYRLDFALPDAPAFQLINVNPSQILRPSSVREFAVSMSNALDPMSGLSIPKAFALEFAPMLLFGGPSLSLSKYQKNPWLYRLRLSAGTRRLQGQAGPSEIALGVRISLIDKSDLRTDQAFIKQITDIDRDIVNVVINHIPPTGNPGEVQLSTLPSEVQDAINSLNQKKSALIADKADVKWNKKAMDVAFAVRFVSKDSLGKDLSTNDLAAWMTYATGFGDWGQLLIGGKASSARDNPDQDLEFEGSLYSRFYVGVNNYKAFLEMQLSTSKLNGDTYLINGGGETMLSNGKWVSVGGGLEYDLDLKKWRVVSKFALKLGLPTG